MIANELFYLNQFKWATDLFVMRQCNQRNVSHSQIVTLIWISLIKHKHFQNLVCTNVKQNLYKEAKKYFPNAVQSLLNTLLCLLYDLQNFLRQLFWGMQKSWNTFIIIEYQYLPSLPLKTGDLVPLKTGDLVIWWFIQL